MLLFIQVIEGYEKGGFDFLKQVFNVPKYLEDLVGLTELHASIVDSDVSILSYLQLQNPQIFQLNFCASATSMLDIPGKTLKFNNSNRLSFLSSYKRYVCSLFSIRLFC